MIKKFRERLFLVNSDLIAINLSFILVFWFKFRSGLIYKMESIPVSFYIVPALMLYLYWFIIFFLAGMYRSWYSQSRFDEMVTTFKTIAAGFTIFLFAVYFGDQKPISRSTFLIYLSSLFVSISIGRIIVRGIQRNLMIKGIGTRNVAVVGTTKESIKIADDIAYYPAVGLKFIGFIRQTGTDGENNDNLKILGNLSDTEEIIIKHGIKDVIFALRHDERELVFDIMGKCQYLDVDFYILPEMYDIVAGHLKTNQIYGFPLVKLFPTLMTPLEEKLKRLIDIAVSSFGLICFAPFWPVVASIIKLESPGPLVFSQERVGKNGKAFNIYKFRSMVSDAEKKTGPVWAKKNDARVTKFGNFMRKTRIDEIPQFINILKGEMSFVGPRPERPFFVEKLKDEIPLYTNRLKVKPGLTGYAQVKHKYDTSLEDVKEKLKYDFYYIENMSLRLDFKIMFRTIFVVLFPGDRVH